MSFFNIRIFRVFFILKVLHFKNMNGFKMHRILGLIYIMFLVEISFSLFFRNFLLFLSLHFSLLPFLSLSLLFLMVKILGFFSNKSRRKLGAVLTKFFSSPSSSLSFSFSFFFFFSSSFLVQSSIRSQSE